MSTHSKQKRLTTASIRAMKGKDRVVCLTAYTTPIARLLDPHCDLLLVGDSLGMVLYGLETTVGVTLDMMVAHGRAVMRGASHACVIVDLPFGSYQESKEQAFRSAVRADAGNRMRWRQAGGRGGNGGDDRLPDCKRGPSFRPRWAYAAACQHGRWVSLARTFR